jgi:hypothetical protein
VNQLVKLQEENEEKEILVEIGANHTIYHKLKEMGLEVKQEFPYEPYIFNLYGELMRRFIYNKPYTRELAARTIVEVLVVDYLDKIGLPFSSQLKNLRKFLEKLSCEDINSLSIFLSKNSWRRIMPLESVILWLRKRGFEF